MFLYGATMSRLISDNLRMANKRFGIAYCYFIYTWLLVYNNEKCVTHSISETNNANL
jgi:hypothetical protein